MESTISKFLIFLCLIPQYKTDVHRFCLNKPCLHVSSLSLTTFWFSFIINLHKQKGRYRSGLNECYLYTENYSPEICTLLLYAAYVMNLSYTVDTNIRETEMYKLLLVFMNSVLMSLVVGILENIEFVYSFKYSLKDNVSTLQSVVNLLRRYKFEYIVLL
jgi:hypothetical protein